MAGLNSKLHRILAMDFNFPEMSEDEWLEWRKDVIGEISRAFAEAGWTPPDTTRDQDAKRVVEAFKEVNNVPSVRVSDKASARVLSQKYGADNIIQIIQVMAAHKGEQYVPSINHIKDIENKWVMIERWFKKNQPRKAEDYGF